VPPGLAWLGVGPAIPTGTPRPLHGGTSAPAPRPRRPRIHPLGDRERAALVPPRARRRGLHGVPPSRLRPKVSRLPSPGARVRAARASTPRLFGSLKAFTQPTGKGAMACLTAGDKERAARALHDRPSHQETYSYLAHSTCERLMVTTCRGIIGMWRGLRGPNSLLRGRY